MQSLGSSGDELVNVIHGLASGNIYKANQSDEIPSLPGAYLLAVFLANPFDLSVSTLPATTLPRGWYIYAGSARGPGGLKARVGRHLRRGKSPRWHIDPLTEAATEMFASLYVEGRECGLMTKVIKSQRFQVPVPGFGSSDCRICPSHLAAFIA
ncbi:MAG: GIY-YIG nuclease family protein [Rhodospirillaceae bacterium]|jgi:Uri superfamily endonuclease|nr:GIY-YIG nuclease family protein [Rhodospirillales bacterium]MBT3904446.1 GIY-YIG nuclease family protein [Rhodospirillaceae bacterium]MBT4701188.1 GIY-YIG nuclease family protein [Rhodospirillaceae bacterium]MBT5034192.1 GIY-YIG nuclease family protein [Rhodospirillaceae bacterium]MBT6219996.1 GIY-YIG nuclease family protein [Rhodospirillaceae bacterium]